jgi:hypothetical protein
LDGLFWATVAIAAGTLVLAVGTVILAWSTRRGVQLQERELKVVEEQLRVATEQFAASQSAARPQLEIDVSLERAMNSPWPVSGQVRYINGSEPAYDVEIWVKTRTQSFGGSAGTILTPSAPTHTFALSGIPDELFKRWPFPEAHKAPVLQGDELWAGVTWRSADGTKGQRRYKRLENGARDENPMHMEPFPVIPEAIRE